MLQTFNESIREALDVSMEKNPGVLLLGLGVDDPKRVFGTTNELVEKYGTERVIECPTSENAYLGHALGLTLGGFTPVVHFQRMDFMLYAFDQLVNNVAKWGHMFPSSKSLPLVMRAIVGMGWGQGAQHSQNLAPLLAQIPGLNVVSPSCPSSAASLLKQSLEAKLPTIFTEHRWLQYLTQEKDIKLNFTLGKSLKRASGKDVTIVTWSYGTVEILRLKELFPNQSWDVIDLLSLQPLDLSEVEKSYRQTGKLFIWEPGWSFGGIGAEIIASLSHVKGLAVRKGFPMTYPSASHREIHQFYPNIINLVECLNRNFDLKMNLKPADISRWPIDQDNSQWSPWHV